MKRFIALTAVGTGIALCALAVAGPDEGGSEGNPRKGRKLFQTTAACSGCHRVHDRGGKLGPDLTHIGATRDAACIAAKTFNPRLGNPNTTMPSASELGLSEANVVDISAYLAGLQ